MLKSLIKNVKIVFNIIFKILSQNTIILFAMFNCIMFDNNNHNSIINYLIYFMLTSGWKLLTIFFINKKTEKIDNKQNKINYFEHKNNIIMHSCIDVASFMYINNFLLTHKNYNCVDTIFSLVKFYPIFFIYEIIFDCFFYSLHYLMHYNKFLYKNIHKIHHEPNKIKSIITFTAHPLEHVLTIELPTIFILSIFSNYYTLSLFEYMLIFYYRTIIELVGHSGNYETEFKHSRYSHTYLYSKINIELTPRDHYLHHKIPNTNYSKRNSLFDKVFGTYKK